MCFVEGCLVRKNNVIWIVKGVEHPAGYLTVFPRYEIKDKETGEGGILVGKMGLKNPEEYYEFLLTKPGYGKLLYNNCAGRATPLFEINEVETFYNPFKPLICEEKRRSEPCLVYEYLASAIEHGEIGLTGSSYFMWTPKSDIDVLIFTKPSNVTQVLEEIKEKTSEISWEEALSIMTTREYHIPSLTTLTRIKRSINQRKVLGNVVFIRILTINPFIYNECRYNVLKEGEAYLQGLVLDERSAVYPYTYRVRVLSSDILEKNQEITIISDRGRFSEAAKKEEKVIVKGDYEAKIYSPRQIEHQVYLWAKHHYIAPMKHVE